MVERLRTRPERVAAMRTPTKGLFAGGKALRIHRARRCQPQAVGNGHGRTTMSIGVRDRATSRECQAAALRRPRITHRARGIHIREEVIGAGSTGNRRTGERAPHQPPLGHRSGRLVHRTILALRCRALRTQAARPLPGLRVRPAHRAATDRRSRRPVSLAPLPQREEGLFLCLDPERLAGSAGTQQTGETSHR